MLKEMYPLDAPGMPPPGPVFTEMAMALGDEVVVEGKGKNKRTLRKGGNLEELMRTALYSPANSFSVSLPVPGGRQVVDVMSGQLWLKSMHGPRQADVMVISKLLGRDEERDRRNFSGEAADLLRDALLEAGLSRSELGVWYVTTLLKCTHPTDGKGWSNAWVKEFLPLLHQELRIVRPKYILCMGADASKALLGKSSTVAGMDGRVVEYTYPVHRSIDDEPEMHTALVMTSMHPTFVLASPDSLEKFQQSVYRFAHLTKGARWDKNETDIDHRIITTGKALAELVTEIKSDPSSYIACPDGEYRPLIAVDAEWHGSHPQNRGSYVRTVQVSWAHKKAACIVLNGPGGVPVFDQGTDKAIYLLNKLLQPTPHWDVRIAGHFLNADLEWLVPLGLDIRKAFEAPATWTDCMSQGGFDTGLAAHSINETDDFSLKYQALKHTSAPRYDIELEAWKTRFCSANKLKAKDLDGYGECPEEVLIPYANYDADVTRRLAMRQFALLTCDSIGQCCWESFWVSMRATAAVLEMNCHGLMCDSERIDLLTISYMQARDELKKQICEWAKWPAFNINSVYHVRELLFGEAYSGKKTPEGVPIRLRPPGGRSMHLTPLFNTDKRPRPWDEVVDSGREFIDMPSTGKQVLGILREEVGEIDVFDEEDDEYLVVNGGDVVGLLRDYRFISQVLKGFLRPPVTNENDEIVHDEDGQFVYDAGLASAICDDDRVRTYLYQTLETGRWASARPAMQNASKQREGDYRRILGKLYTHPLRSIIRAAPGCVLIESDFTGAELLGAAIMADDHAMIEHCLRNQLSEDHPDYYDIHSNIAKLAFRLDCEPTKDGLKAIDKVELRIVAKSVIFGAAYGRGAKAIAVACKETGTEITTEEAQAVIDTIFNMYPGLKAFFESCRARVHNPGWLCNAFGRFRRFPKVAKHETKLLADMERQAMNAPIQGLVADAMSRAVDNLRTYRDNYTREELWYDLALQIHDAVILEAEAKYVPIIVDKVMPECMSQQVPIYPCRLDGTPLGTGPYRLGAETEISIHWGETMLPSECEELGIDPKYAHWKRVENGLVNSSFRGKIWTRGELVDLPK